MKMLRNLTASILLLTAASIYVHAEDRAILTVKVPFAFTAETLNLLAGTYRISVSLPYNTVKLQNVEGGKSVMLYFVPSSLPQESETGKLTFEHIGDRYFLTQIWEQGNDLRRDIRAGALARDLAEARTKPQPTGVIAGAGSR